MKKLYYRSFIIINGVCPCTGKGKSIDEIEIHARAKVAKEREEFKRHAQSTEVISDYEINRNNPAFMEQSLGTMAGVQVEKEPNWVDRGL